MQLCGTINNLLKNKMAIDKEVIRTMFTEQCKTTSEIAAHFEVSSQCIHRYIKLMGLTRRDGGKAGQMKVRAIEASEEVIVKKQGCTQSQWDRLRAMDEDYKLTPLFAYNTFKNNFQNSQPEVEFNLPLWDWWELWEESGKWGLHKRNPQGMYIIACTDKSKPLTKTNATVRPFAEVLRETRARNKKST
jgi:hypothetical protein